MSLPRSSEYFLDKLTTLARHVRTAILHARNKNADLSSITKRTSADTIYSLDTHVEPIITNFCEQWSQELPLLLIAEGIADQNGIEGRAMFPHGTPESNAKFILLIDPIDGTRGLMYDKRPAWFLAAIAPNHGPHTSLQDIEFALQLELPTTKQHLADTLWAAKGQGAHAIREQLTPTLSFNLHPSALSLQPSTATTLLHGFASISNFFPGTKQRASQLMEIIAQNTTGRTNVHDGAIFDDQYISTAGQLYELITGKDRFNADLRPLFYQIQKQPPGLCCHPYDLATALIAQEAGILLTNALGQPLNCPLDTTTPVSWAAFANPSLKNQIEPIMLQTLTRWLNESHIEK
jgi:fructose-1,6-bisphosphatase/inositol monophosphatase family enzyme